VARDHIHQIANDVDEEDRYSQPNAPKRPMPQADCCQSASGSDGDMSRIDQLPSD